VRLGLISIIKTSSQKKKKIEKKVQEEILAEGIDHYWGHLFSTTERCK
jgi:hypothetical protein